MPRSCFNGLIVQSLLKEKRTNIAGQADSCPVAVPAGLPHTHSHSHSHSVDPERKPA